MEISLDDIALVFSLPFHQKFFVSFLLVRSSFTYVHRSTDEIAPLPIALTSSLLLNIPQENNRLLLIGGKQEAAGSVRTIYEFNRNLGQETWIEGGRGQGTTRLELSQTLNSAHGVVYQKREQGSELLSLESI